MSAAELSAPDIVVVGAGAAGAALAARLSEDPGRRVLLLEAGPAPHDLAGYPPELRDAGTVLGADPRHPDNWAYPALLTPDRPYSIARGRILGGSTAINGAYFVRPRPRDLDRWAAAGGPAWAADAVLPLLRAMETDLDYGSTSLHGGDGPMRVRRMPLGHPADVAFRAAAQELGFPDEPDKNGADPAGFGAVPANAVDGLRWNTALGYLFPAAGRANLEIRGGARVARVILRGGRAAGVELIDGTAIAAGEVVLTAGAVATPQLLMLSGVGPREQLEGLGIEVVRDAPGVGSAFGDHPQVLVEWLPRRPLPRVTGRWMTAVLNADDADGSIEVLQSALPEAALIGGAPVGDDDPLPFFVSVQDPGARSGSLRLASADPARPPAIDYGYLGTAAARGRMRQAVRLTADLVHSPGFAEVSAGLIGLDDATLRDDDALDGWVRGRLGTSIHLCATAPMGAADDPMAVVDGEGRVHGVAALRVADTSILPSAPTRGPAASAVLVGELIASAMRSGA